MGKEECDNIGGEVDGVAGAAALGMQDNGHGLPAGAPYKSMFYDIFGEDMGWSHAPTAYDASAITFDSSNKIITDDTADFAVYGQFCYPDDRKLFVRCCADHGGSQCIACEAGKTRARGAEDFNDAADFFSGNDGSNVAAWGTQTCI